MKRVIVKTPLAKIAPKKKGRPRKHPVVVYKEPRPCTREGCENKLTPNQKKYCSHMCRYRALNANGNPGAMSLDKYKPEYATTKFQEYLDFCEKGQEPTLIPTESSYIVIHNAKLPTLENYATYLGVHHSTLLRWCDRFTDFAHALDLMKDIQRSFLINNGLARRYDSSIAKLLLGTNHGIIERTQVDNTHKLIGVVKHIYEEVDKLEKKMYGRGS